MVWYGLGILQAFNSSDDKREEARAKHVLQLATNESYFIAFLYGGIQLIFHTNSEVIFIHTI